MCQILIATGKCMKKFGRDDADSLKILRKNLPDASVISAFTTDSSASTALDVVQRELKYLGLWKFAGAVMYVLKEVLGLSEEKMIAPMDEKRGRLLLAEILNGDRCRGR